MSLPLGQVLQGNCLEVLKNFPDESVDFVQTSPPYWGLRCYGKETETIWGGDSNCKHEWIEEKQSLVHENRNFSEGTQEEVHGEKQTTYIKKYDDSKANTCVKCGAWRGQLGLEPHPQLYIEHLVLIFREVKRVLKKTGSVYIVLGDTFAGSHCGKGDVTLFGNFRRQKVAEVLYNKPTPQAEKFSEEWLRPKQQLNIPFHVAFALQQDGWIQRARAIWHKNNAMPGSQKDRLTCSYEFIFHFVKNDKTVLWRNMETGEWRDSMPVQMYVKNVGNLRVATTERPAVLKKQIEECSDLEVEERKKWRRMWMGFDYYYELDAIREPHKSLFAPFNLRVRDVKRGKGGLSAQGMLRASPTETEGYAYPESGRMRRLVQKLYEISQKIRGESYEGKNTEVKGWSEVASNVKAYRDALKILEEKEQLSEEEKKFLKDYVQNHLGHPLGRNPGDVLRYGSKYEQEAYGQTLQAFIREQSVAKRREESRVEAQQLFPNDHEKQKEYIKFVHDHDSHPLGPAPRDVIKHDLAVGRTRNVSYTDPLHTRDYHEQGKNPGDVVSERVKANLEHFLPRGSGGHYAYGGLDSKEAKHEHELGRNPRDVYSFDGRNVGTNVGEKGKLVDGVVQWRPQTRMLRLDGKNPGDIFRDKTEDEGFKGPLTSRQAPEPSEPNAFHPLGKNPTDVLKFKGDESQPAGRLAKSREQYRAEGLPEGHLLGKNPGDVTKIGSHHGSSLSGEGRATHYKGQLIEAHVLGANPSDFWSINTKPFSGTRFVADYVGENGKFYKASPDCPIHGHLARSENSRMESCDEQQAELSNCTSDIESHHDEEHTCEQKSKFHHDTEDDHPSKTDSQSQHNVQTEKHHDIPLNKTLDEQHLSSSIVHAENFSHTNRILTEPKLEVDNSDSSLRDYAQTANEHNKKNHKKLFQNEQHDSADVETLAHKQYTLQEHVDAERHPDISESKTLAGPSLNEREKGLSVEKGNHTLNSETPYSKKCTCSVIRVDHFAVMPEEICIKPILSSSPPNGIVLDPFVGSGTTCVVAKKLGRRYIGIDINTDYVNIARGRLADMEKSEDKKITKSQDKEIGKSAGLEQFLSG